MQVGISMKYIKRFIFWGGLTAFIIGGIFGIRLLPAYLEELTAPAQLHLLDGTIVAGVPDVIEPETQIVINVIFSAKCAACAEYIPALNSLHDPPYIYVVGVNIGDSDSAVRKFKELHSIEFPIILGIRKAPEGISSVPTTFLFANTEAGWQLLTEWQGARMPPEVLEYINGFYEWLEEQE